MTESGWYFSVFSSHDICMPFCFTTMAYDSPPYYSNYGMMISFLAYKIFKSQFIFHTKQRNQCIFSMNKSDIFTSEMILYQFTSE